LEDVNGFDEKLGYGTPFAFADIDILARMSAKGWSGAYDPRPLVYHHHGRQLASEIERLKKTYDHARGAYYMKCILNLRIRKKYIKDWYMKMQSQKLNVTLNEVIRRVSLLRRSY